MDREDMMGSVEMERGRVRAAIDGSGLGTRPAAPAAAAAPRHAGPAPCRRPGLPGGRPVRPADRFFRFVGRAILEHHSCPSGLPLMLATLREYHAPFRKVSQDPFLTSDGIKTNPEALSLDQRRTEAWQIVEPHYLKRLAKRAEDFQVARSRQLGSDDLAQVAEAAMAGRVGILLVEAGREIPGKLDSATGQIEPGDLDRTGIDDILDDLAETVLRMKGEVVVVPAERMPSNTGLAATYRF